MKSKTGMYHKVGMKFQDGTVAPMCQSYNLDRMNPLFGEPIETPPENAKVCKKCLKHKEEN